MKDKRLSKEDCCWENISYFVQIKLCIIIKSSQMLKLLLLVLRKNNLLVTKTSETFYDFQQKNVDHKKIRAKEIKFKIRQECIFFCCFYVF